VTDQRPHPRPRPRAADGSHDPTAGVDRPDRPGPRILNRHVLRVGEQVATSRCDGGSLVMRRADGHAIDPHHAVLERERQQAGAFRTGPRPKHRDGVDQADTDHRADPAAEVALGVHGRGVAQHQAVAQFREALSDDVVERRRRLQPRPALRIGRRPAPVQVDGAIARPDHRRRRPARIHAHRPAARATIQIAPAGAPARREEAGHDAEPPPGASTRGHRNETVVTVFASRSMVRTAWLFMSAT
jgi:hypothetical protein